MPSNAYTPALSTTLPTVMRARTAFAVIAGLGVAVHAAWAIAGASSVVVDNWIYCGLYMLAAASCAYRGRRGDDGLAWDAAAIGVLIWGGAEIVFRLQTDTVHAWYPRLSQAMLFVAFLFAYTTLGLLARERVRQVDLVLGLDGVLSGLTAAAVAAVVLFPVLGGPHAGGPDAPPEVFLLSALAGLMFVVTVVGMTGWRPGTAWGLITVAIAINVAGDAILVHLAGHGRFHRGSLADTLFVSSALLLGLAAFYPSRYAGAPRDAARRLPAPLISAAAALAVLIGAVAGGAGGLAAGLAAAAVAVMIARMAIALDSLEHSRTEALFDELTALGNRRLLIRDLDRRLSRAPEQRPFVLALFDLDGFKRYNDTFGHPSGDELLARLAGRLTTALAPGIGYRMGGDEFCAIVDGEGPSVKAALSRAQLALSETGDAFSITCSSGTVRCPAEADDTSSALRIADGRMYVAKAGRALEQAQTRDAVLKMLEERDPELHEHMTAVAAMALRVARRLGLDELVSQHVRRAAELHDIGKIAVPDAILHKPARLDAREQRFMRQYPLVGERILRAAPSLSPLAPLVRACHERWDGRGYPDGLREAESPIGARIIAACDAFDAMRSRQAYRRARTDAEAIAELTRCAGTQFDPEVVDALCQEVVAGESPGRG